MQTLHGTELISCVACGGAAQLLTVHRSVHQTYASRLLASGSFLLRPSFLPAIVGVGVAGAWFPWALAVGTFWAFFFSIVRSSARGESELHPPDFTEVWSDCILPAFRGMLGTALLWLPAFLYGFSRWKAGNLESLGELFTDPVLWLIIAASIAYVPMVLMSAAAGAGILRLLNPVAIVLLIQRMGRDYWLSVGALVALSIPSLIIGTVAGGIRSLDIFIASNLIAESLEAIVPLFSAHVLGLLLYVRGDSVGYGLDSDYQEPALPGTTPRGALPARSPPEAKPERQPLSLSDEVPLPVAPREASPAPSPPAPETLTTFSRAVTARDVEPALALYPALEASGVPLPAPSHLFVGQAAATQGQLELAVRALQAAASVDPQSPTAPRALVMLARVYGERLSNPEQASAIYARILEHYPDTDAARFARQRMGK